MLEDELARPRLKHFGWGREGEGMTAAEEAFTLPILCALFSEFSADHSGGGSYGSAATR